MTILYNIASRSRPIQLKELLDNIVACSNYNWHDILLKLDTDDPYLNEYAEITNAWYLTDLKVIIGNHKSKIEAINASIPSEGYGILVNVSDDQRFTVKGFDQIIRENCGPDTFLHLPDAYKRAACSTLSIMGRKYYERAGYIYSEAYYSLWADTEATEVAKLLGCYKYIPTIIHEHRHYSTGYPIDALYKRNNTYKTDRAIYWKRRAANFELPQPRDPFLLIKYATRGRWKMFFAAIDNIYATIRTNQFKIVVTADIDDVEMNCSEVQEFCRRYPNVELNYGTHANKVAAINDDFNPRTMWLWCVCMSDDMVFTQYGWDYKMLEDVRRWFVEWDWFAHFNDGFTGPALPTLNVCGREWYNRFNYIYHPSYKSVSCDAENMFVAQMLGRYAYFDTVYFNHLHPANTHEPSDYIYRRNHEAGASDTTNYFERLKKMFYIDNPAMVPEEMKPYL